MAPINQKVISGLHIMVKEVCEIFLSCKITQDWGFYLFIYLSFSFNKPLFVNVCLRSSSELGFVWGSSLV